MRQLISGGNGVVGNNQIEEAWLDEGLTEFSTILFYEQVRGRGQEEARSLISLYQAYQQANGDGKILRPLNEFPGELAYTALVYGKGCLLFCNYERRLGKNYYCKFCKRTIAVWPTKNATGEDLIQVD